MTHTLPPANWPINGHWKTVDELAFLEGIGTWSTENSDTGVPLSWRIEALRGYLAGCRLRTDWCEVDSVVVVARARELLALAGAK